MKRVLIATILMLLMNSNAHAILVGFWDFNEESGLVAHDGSSFGNKIMVK